MSFPDLPPEVQAQLLQGPAMPPPNGTDSNFDNPINNNAYVFSVITAFLVIVTICLIIRLYVSFILIKQHIVADYLMIATYGLFVGICGIAYWWIESLGVIHQWDMHFSQLEHFLWMMHVFCNLYFAALLTLKCAILIEWIRILFPTHYRTLYWWIIHGTLVVTVLGYLGLFLAWNLNCQPFEATWNPTIAGSCGPMTTVELACVVVNMGTDLAILLLPQPIIWKLQMPTSRKIAISLMFVVGVMAVAAGAVRTYYMTWFYWSKDIAWLSGYLYVWSAIEIACGSMTYCAISLPKFCKESKILSSITSKLRTSFSSSSKDTRTRSSKQLDGSGYVESTEGIDLSKSGSYYKISDKQYSQEV